MTPGGARDHEHDRYASGWTQSEVARFARDGGSRVGELLRQTREEYRLSLEDVAEVLRIKEIYLAALEVGDIGALPAPAYATGFIRAYSEYLGLDSEEIVRRFKNEKNANGATPELNFPVPLTERGIPGSSIVLIALILGAIGYVSWNWYTTGPHGSVAQVEPVPARLLPPPSLDPPSVSPESAAAAEPPPPAPPPQPVAQTAALPPPATDTTPAADHIFGSPTPGKVSIKATGDAWVEVLDSDHPIWSRLLKPGEIYNPPKDGLTMIVGNAGGIEVTVNGKVLPPIGASGEVRRIPLDPDKLAGGG